MKYLETHILSEEERLSYSQKGLYCYDMRSSDFGGEIASIERKVYVNIIGSMITNEEIKMGKEYPNNYVDYDEFVSKNNMVNTVDELLGKIKLKEEKLCQR